MTPAPAGPSNPSSRPPRTPITAAPARSSPSPSIDHILSLRTRRARDDTGTFFVDGVRFLVAAVDAGMTIDALVTCPRMLKSMLGQMIVRRLRGRGIPELRVDPADLARISSSHEPQGVGAIVRQKWEPSLDAIAPEHGACWLALEDVRSPGNLGTLLRTTEAMGASGLITLGRSVDPYDVGCVRATMGSIFTRRLVRASPIDLGAWARRNGVTIVGATGDATTDYRAVSYSRPVVIVLGAERKGLSHAARAACDVAVRIPMVGRTDSLNLAVAGSVLLYEVFSQRHPRPREQPRSHIKAR